MKQNPPFFFLEALLPLSPQRGSSIGIGGGSICNPDKNQFAFPLETRPNKVYVRYMSVDLSDKVKYLLENNVRNIYIYTITQKPQ